MTLLTILVHSLGKFMESVVDQFNVFVQIHTALFIHGRYNGGYVIKQKYNTYSVSNVVAVTRMPTATVR